MHKLGQNFMRKTQCDHHLENVQGWGTQDGIPLPIVPVSSTRRSENEWFHLCTKDKQTWKKCATVDLYAWNNK